MRTTLTALLVLALPLAAGADVRLPNVLKSGCVLQQQADAAIFGFASSGEAVTVQTSWGKTASTKAGPDGRWLVKVRTPAAADAKGPQSFTVTGASSTVTSDNVAIGEVWLCGGQSNMQWAVTQSEGGKEEIAGANNPDLRLFMVEMEPSLWPRADNRGSWQPTNPKSVEWFSGVGYFFGKDLNAKLKVPVGLIHCNWGGTRLEPWLSPAAIARFPAYAPMVAQMELLKDPGQRDKVAGEGVRKWWDSFDEKGPKVGAGWSAPGFDDAAWKTMPVPSTWSADGLDTFDGVVYYRLAFDVPAASGGKPATLTLGPIDDRDDAFINGKPVGATREDGKWNSPRSYEVPAGLLTAGRNVLAVRVLDQSGLGGIGGVGSKPEMVALSFPGGPSIPLAGDWKYLKGPTLQEVGAPPAVEASPYWSPSYLFNGMVTTVAPHTLRGAVWYQGESNRDNGAGYRPLLEALFADWRSAFQSPEMAFGVVELAPFTYGGDTGQTSMVREAQRLAALGDSRGGLAVTMDIGNPKDIHPTNKKEVGRRLGLWALARVYGQPGFEYSGPIYAGMTAQGASVRVKFDHVGAGLEARGGPLTHWQLAGADKVFHKATARIDGPTVVVEAPEVPAPIAVRYGWEDACEPNFFNKDGLPASPFRSDTWSLGETKVAAVDVRQHRGKDAGLAALFNGKDLAGWVNVNCAPSTFSAGQDESGEPVIKCTGVPTGVLRTAEMHENFVLELEWRHLKKGGNAGVFVWSDALTAPGQPFTRSVEVQVLDGQEGPTYTSDGDVFPIHGATMVPENPRPNGGQRAYPTSKRMNPSPEWNHYRITCDHGAITLAVNGEVVTRGRECSLRRGYICLESEGGEIQWRNLRIKDLPATTPPLPESQVAQADQGWKSLYTGVDFAGWKYEKAHEGHWKAEDWTIDFDGKAPDLWTTASYRDFELIADWRWSGPVTEVEYPVILPSGEYQKDAAGKNLTAKVKSAGDSGLYLRGSSKSQINIWCWPIGSGEVYGYRTDPKMPAAVKAGVTPKAVADKPIGEWNRFHAVMKGDRLTVDLNGVRVLDQAQLPGVDPEGPIALQNHGDPIQFANLFVRPLN